MQRSVLFSLHYSAPAGGAGHGTIRLRGGPSYGAPPPPAPVAPAPPAAAGGPVGHGTIRMGRHVNGVSFAPVRLPDPAPRTPEGVAGTSNSLFGRINLRG